MAAAPVSVVTPSAIEGRELGSDLIHVLVAAARKRQAVEAVPAAALRPRTRSGGGGVMLVEEPGDRVAGLERGDGALEPGELTKGPQRLGIGGGDVPRT